MRPVVRGPASDTVYGMWRWRRTDVEKAVSDVWKAHGRAEFPARLRGEELAGVDLVMLDAGIAGCAATWRENHGALDEPRRLLLARLLRDLDRVLPMLDDPQEQAYYERLRQLGRLVSGSSR